MKVNPYPIRVIIVEDELASQRALELTIDKYCPELKILGKAQTVDEAIELIDNTNPHIVFLDIRLPGKNGFHLLEYLNDFSFEVIITSAYEKYASTAFRYAAIDYLLKPIHPEELKEAVKRYKEKRLLKANPSKLKNLGENLKNNVSQKMAIATLDGYKFVPVNKIIRCEADGNYTTFVLVDSGKLVSSRNLKSYESALDGLVFYRIHRSHIINLNFVDRYRKGKNPEIEMKNGEILPISQVRKIGFEEELAKFMRGDF
ncbi:MAG: LytTR family DNA-binding domain-containing protein [Bacteroidia bacterium]|nr:LytTR family DNA-binding domain-containing protein [Bacteroidia bacterium]